MPEFKNREEYEKWKAERDRKMKEIFDKERELSEQIKNKQVKKETAVPQNKIFQCQASNCGYIYNPDKGDVKGGIPAGTQYEDLPDGWKCPQCGAGRHFLIPLS